MRIPCVALRSFYYEMTTIEKDADCDIDEKDVQILEMAKAVARKPEKSKRQYKRRDMTAENP
jgi:hypothetical protein